MAIALGGSPSRAAVPTPVVGNVTVNDANILPGDLVIGDSTQRGELTIGSGGSIENIYGYVGADPVVGGNVARIVNGGAWTNLGDLYVGALGASNSMVISNGGAVLTAGVSYLGWGASAGSSSVFIAGGTWTNAGDVYVGSFGTNAALSVSGGGVASFGANLFAASEFGVDGHRVVVTGAASRLDVAADFYQGMVGGGVNLVVSNGAHLSSANAYLGLGADSVGNSALITGSNSLWTNTGRIVLAAAGEASLTVAGGATLAASEITVAEVAGALGTLNVGNFGESDEGGELAVSAIGFGAGQAVINFNQSVSRTVFATVSGNGAVNQRGSGTTVMSASNSYTGTTVVGNGALRTTHNSALGTSAVQLDAGSLAPVGRLDIQSLTWNGGTISSTLGTSTSFVGISSNFTLGPGGGVFAFAADSGFSANVGYDIMGWTNWGSVAAGNFSGNSLLGFNPIFSLGGTNLTVRFVGGATNGPIIQNSAPTFTPTNADFFVSNNVATADTTQNNTVRSLVFASGGSLQIYNQLQVTSGNLTVGSGSAVVRGGQLYVPGDFAKIGGGLLDLLGQVRVDGNASVNAGSLMVNGEFAANSLTVMRNALLGGAGTIFGNVFNNGTVSPGNSPGTLTIVGNYAQGSSGNFVMEIAGPNNFDRLVVTGAATLAGVLTVVTLDGGALSFGDKYQFLSAGGGISGEFDTINMPSGFRGRFLTDNSNTQGTLLVAPLSYTQVAVTPNQRRVAKALDAFIPAKSGDRETVSIALDELTAQQYPAAFEAIMPSLYASLPTMAFNVANALNTSMFQRMWMQRANNSGFSSSGLAPEPLQGELKNVTPSAEARELFRMQPDLRWSVFVDGNGVFANANSAGALQDYKSQSGGVAAGASYKWNENFATGVYVGYQGLQAQYDNGSRLIDNAVRFGGFGTLGIGGWYLNGLVGGAWHTYDVDREIEFGTIDRTARGNPDAGEFDLALATGYDFRAGNFTFGPVTSMQYTYVGVQGFQENGADSLNLDVDPYNASSLLYSLGAQMAYRWEVSEKFAITPMLSASWQHEFMQNAYPINAAFNAGGPSSSFFFQTSQPQQDYFMAGAGVGFEIGETWDVSFFWNAVVGNTDLNSQNIYLSIGADF